MSPLRLPRRAGSHSSQSGRQHVRLISRLIVAQAGAGAAVSLLFSHRSLPLVITTLAFAAALCLLAALAGNGTHTARTVVLGAEAGVLLFGLYRFAFQRYVGGTVFAIVIVAALMHPAVVRAFTTEPSGRPGRPRGISGDGAGELAGPGGKPISDPAGGPLGESAGR